MGWWTSLRDTVEAAAVIAGNYYLPGSSLITSKLVSDGAQQKLNSKVGRVANVASGGAGGLEGNLGNWGSAASAAGDYTGLSDLFSGGAAGGTSAAPATIDAGTASMTSADVANTGANAQDLSSMTANTATNTPVFAPDTVAQGSNVPPPTTDYGTAGGQGNYGYDMGTGTAVSGTPATSPNMIGADLEQMPANMPAYSAVNVPIQGAAPGFLESMSAGNYGDAASAAGNYMMDNKMGTAMVGSSLYDMYAKRKMAKRQEDLYNQNRNDILGMYAPGSPEEIAMQREMARKDAAAGRNSQYGIRATDYAGNVAKFRSNALANLSGNQNALAAAQMGNQYGGLNSMFNNMAMYSLLNKKTT